MKKLLYEFIIFSMNFFEQIFPAYLRAIATGIYTFYTYKILKSSVKTSQAQLEIDRFNNSRVIIDNFILSINEWESCRGVRFRQGKKLEAIHKNALQIFEKYYRGSYNLSSGVVGEWVANLDALPKDYLYEDVSRFFIEGPEDGGAIDFICQKLEHICSLCKRQLLDAEYVWYEVGFFISIINAWFENHDEKSDSGYGFRTIFLNLCHFANQNIGNTKYRYYFYI